MLPAVPLALAASLLAPAVPAAAVADPVRTLAQEIVSSGATGVQIRSVRNGHARTVTAGVSELDSRKPLSPTGRFRIGSTTKMFVATVTLQLVAEHRLGLDAPVEQYLPGLLPRGKDITVRMLLRHTSGLCNYLRTISLVGTDLEKVRYQHFSPERLVAIAAAQPLDFRPGSAYSYSNTNYTVLGMLIERTTGHAWGDEVAKRILRPLGMHDTMIPGDRTRIPGRHAHGYQEMNGKLVDVSELNPSVAGAAGEIISTTADLDKFVEALAAGRLVPPALLRQMTTPRSVTEEYGLGVQTRTTPCGIPVFGHAGGIPGYGTVAFTSADGKRRVEASLTLGRGPDNRHLLFADRQGDLLLSEAKPGPGAQPGPGRVRTGHLGAGLHRSRFSVPRRDAEKAGVATIVVENSPVGAGSEAEAARDLALAVARAIREFGASTGPVRADANIAAAEVSIDGQGSMSLTSVSGKSERGGMVPKPGVDGNSHRYMAFPTGSNDRELDTELKILTYVANRLGHPRPRFAVQ